MKARRQRSLVLIDIAVPRNIDPEVNHLENVYLYDIDDLETVMRHNRQQRESELADCRQIIAHAVAALWPRLTPRPEAWAAPLQPQAGWRLPRAAAAAGI
jgi:glutamyl-tRNA reductase